MIKRGNKHKRSNKKYSHKSKKLIKILLFSLLGLFLIGVIVLGIYLSLNFVKSEAPVVTVGSGLESVILSPNLQSALVKLNSSINLTNLNKIKFVFKVNGTSRFYEMNKSAGWTNSSFNNTFNLFASFFNLTDFRQLTNVSIIPVYVENRTSSTTTSTRNTQNNQIVDNSGKKTTVETPKADSDDCTSSNVTYDYSCNVEGNSGDVYYYDNCDTIKAKKQDCNSTQECIDDECVNRCIATNFTNSSQCYSDKNVYYYDDCGIRNNLTETGNCTGNGQECRNSTICQDPLVCDLTSAVWGNNSAYLEHAIEMKVNGTDCENKMINYEIWKQGLPIYYNRFNNQTFVKSWSAGEYIGGEFNLGTYYFIASLSNNLSVNITSEILNVTPDPCSGISSCDDFNLESDCISNSCNLNCTWNSTNCIVNPCIGISNCNNFNLESSCNLNSCGLSCVWNSTAVPPVCDNVMLSLSPWTSFIEFFKRIFGF